MEIILQGSTLDNLIDSQMESIQSREETIQSERKAAEDAAIVSLVRQFQNEISTYLNSAFQSTVGLQYLPPKEISIYSVCAYFSYMNTPVYVRRSVDAWEVTCGDEIIKTSGDVLQKEILIQLSKVRSKAT